MFKHTDKLFTGNCFLNKACTQACIACCGRDIKVCDTNEKDKKIFLHIWKKSVEELLCMVTMISFPLLVMPI